MAQRQLAQGLLDRVVAEGFSGVVCDEGCVRRNGAADPESVGELLDEGNVNGSEQVMQLLFGFDVGGQCCGAVDGAASANRLSTGGEFLKDHLGEGAEFRLVFRPDVVAG